MARRLDRQRYVERLASDAERRAAEEQAEARRERMHGSSRQRYTHAPNDHGMGAAGDEDGHGGAASSSSTGPRRRRDMLGYYRLLGLAEAGD